MEKRALRPPFVVAAACLSVAHNKAALPSSRLHFPGEIVGPRFDINYVD